MTQAKTNSDLRPFSVSTSNGFIAHYRLQRVGAAARKTARHYGVKFAISGKIYVCWTARDAVTCHQSWL